MDQTMPTYICRAPSGLLSDKSKAELPRADVIQGLFDLTPAESRVARLIAGGDTVGTIAIASQTTEGRSGDNSNRSLPRPE